MQRSTQGLFFPLAFLVCLLGPGIARADIVTNGGFEAPGGILLNSGSANGNLYSAPGWTISDPNAAQGADFVSTGVCKGPSVDPNCANPPFYPHTGSNAFWGGAFSGTYLNQTTNTGNLPGTLSQMLTTTAGTNYTLSFWLAEVGGGGDKFWNVKWDGTIIDSGHQSAIGYTLFSLPVQGTGSDTLLFSFFDNGGYAYLLDDVSVNAPVPEPGSAVLLITMLSGVAGMVGVFRKKFRAS